MRKYKTTVRVQYYETDAMGIVHHSNYIRYFETARTEMFRTLGYSYDAMEKTGVWMPVLGVTADFKTPAVYDEEIVLVCWIERLKGASIDLAYAVKNADTGEVHATGTSSHGFTTPDLKPIRLKRDAPKIYEIFKNVLE